MVLRCLTARPLRGSSPKGSLLIGPVAKDIFLDEGKLVLKTLGRRRSENRRSLGLGWLAGWLVGWLVHPFNEKVGFAANNFGLSTGLVLVRRLSQALG